MKLEDVKRNLNKMVRYKDSTGIYKLTACILRKNESGFVYQAELLDTKSTRSVLICKLEDIEEIGGEK